MRWNRAVPAYLVLLLVLAPAAGSAEPFGQPVTLSTPGRNATAPAVAVDGQGVVHAVWAETQANGNDVVRYARNRPGQGWSAPTPLTTDAGDASDPSIATNARGDLVVAWASTTPEQTALVVRRRPAGGPWGPPTTLSSPGDSPWGPQAAINNDRDLVVAWSNLDPVTHDQEAVVRVRLAGRPWGAAHSLAPGVDASGAQLVLDPTGTVTAAWTDLIGPPRNETTRVRVASKPAGRSWTTPVKVSGSSITDLHPVLALRGGTTPWLAWEHAADTVPGIWIRHRTASGWSRASRVTLPRGRGFSPALDANAAGQLIVAWSSLSGKLRSRFLTPAGTWRPVAVAVSPGTGYVVLPQVEIARDSRAVGLWRQGGATFVGRFRPRSNEWGAIRKVPGEHVTSPVLAMNPMGDVVVAWRVFVDPARIAAMISRN